MFSPNKPIIQKEDLANIKDYFDICIGSSSSEASPETKSEYEVLMKRQATLQNLKDLDSDIMSWLLETPSKNSNTLGKYYLQSTKKGWPNFSAIISLRITNV
ncbi:uncharacterized protein B0P05DRAFT_504658 [Gilbertella persicaria]|uniref:uncharacterized protein n=1 Tax=Gilbertella persicaria TaxID=101096 RepID=UPI00222119A9|nr:uncharacterized protein B0P05DRAFT_504658 [Gilbertella persicaria]KAI8091070.1 hypothetical protein B0P05DRAFT_504658 [Gilbertella persicaria]